MNQPNIIEEVKPLEFIKIIDRKNKRFQAILLQSLEEIFSSSLIEDIKENPTKSSELREKNTKRYKAVRKLVLDWSNDYTRAVCRQIFGDAFEDNLNQF